MSNQNHRGRHAKHAAPSSRDEWGSSRNDSPNQPSYGSYPASDGRPAQGGQGAYGNQSGYQGNQPYGDTAWQSGASPRANRASGNAYDAAGDGLYQQGASQASSYSQYGYSGQQADPYGYDSVRRGNTDPFAPVSAGPSASRGIGRGADPYQAGQLGGVSGVSGINPSSTSVDYSRDLYQAGGRRNTRKRGRTVLKVVLIVLAALVVGAGAFAFWFTTQLDGALANRSDSKANEALVASDIRKPYYMLLIGSDERETGQDTAEAAKAVTASGDSGSGYSDVLMLIRIDAENDLVTLVSVPRDTPYRTSDGELIKINEMYLREGAKGSIRAVSELTGVPISHYAIVHVSSLIEIVDSLGGIEVDVPQTITTNDTTTGDWITVEAGRQVLDGHQAQVFARARHEYEDGEVQRQSNVRYLFSAIASAALNRPLPEIPGTIINLAGYVGTDYKTGDLVTLASTFSTGGVKTKYYSATGPSNGDTNPANNQWMCYPNPEGWSALMDKVNAGEDPKGIDYAATEKHSWD